MTGSFKLCIMLISSTVATFGRTGLSSKGNNGDSCGDEKRGSDRLKACSPTSEVSVLTEGPELRAHTFTCYREQLDVSDLSVDAGCLALVKCRGDRSLWERASARPASQDACKI